MNLISYSSHAEELKEWSYYEDGAERGGEPLGPITKEEVWKVIKPKSNVKSHVCYCDLELPLTHICSCVPFNMGVPCRYAAARQGCHKHADAV